MFCGQDSLVFNEIDPCRGDAVGALLDGEDPEAAWLASILV